MESNIPYLCDRCKHVNTCDCAYDEYNRVINDDWTDDCLGMKQMGKCITINSCKDCPYSGVDYFREHFMKAWCDHPQMKWTNNNWEWHSKTIEEESDYLAFPPWCPLMNRDV